MMMCHFKKTLLDKICEILKVSYGEEFMLGGTAYKIEPYRLMRKYPYGWELENFEKILKVVIDDS